jgi:hypothetical protein
VSSYLVKCEDHNQFANNCQHQEWAKKGMGDNEDKIGITQWAIGGVLLGAGSVLYKHVMTNHSHRDPGATKLFIGAAKICQYIIKRDYVIVPSDWDHRNFPLSPDHFTAYIGERRFSFENAGFLFKPTRKEKEEEATMEFPSDSKYLKWIRDIRGETLQLVFQEIFEFLNVPCSVSPSEALLLAGYNNRKVRRSPLKKSPIRKATLYLKISDPPPAIGTIFMRA